MECRCPACDAVLLWTDPITETSWITCHACDRGFRPSDARCVDCAAPFGKTDWNRHRCTIESNLGLHLVAHGA
ncbi:MAG: hypothetical protein WBX15_04280 [Thermoanaerobaculia bacterium]